MKLETKNTKVMKEKKYCYKKKSKRTTRFKRIWNMSELTRSILKKIKHLPIE